MFSEELNYQNDSDDNSYQELIEDIKDVGYIFKYDPIRFEPLINPKVGY